MDTVILELTLQFYRSYSSSQFYYVPNTVRIINVRTVPIEMGHYQCKEHGFGKYIKVFRADNTIY